MARKSKKVEEVKKLEFVNKLTDEQIYEYIYNEIRKSLPEKDLPLILITDDMKDRPKKVGAYYAKVGKIIREDDCISQTTNITYSKYNNGRWLAGGGYNVNLKITDFDCINTESTRYRAHPNETWVDYVNGIVKDKQYMGKAKKYMHDTYPEFFEERKTGKVYLGYGDVLSGNDKVSMHL